MSDIDKIKKATNCSDEKAIVLEALKVLESNHYFKVLIEALKDTKDLTYKKLLGASRQDEIIALKGRLNQIEDALSLLETTKILP